MLAGIYIEMKTQGGSAECPESQRKGLRMTYVCGVVVITRQDGVSAGNGKFEGSRVAVGSTLGQGGFRSGYSRDGASEGDDKGGDGDGELHFRRRVGRISVGGGRSWGGTRSGVWEN
jgi:hypothetical protein